MAYLTTEPIDLPALLGSVNAARHGGVVTFLGTVRDHHAGRTVVDLQYEAFGPMAESQCSRIVAEAESRWPCRIALRHRIGRLAIGETAVAIAVGSAHRSEAFDACRYVIEELKRRVPIWKRERYTDGTEAWVDPTSAAGVVPAAVPEPAP